MDASAMAASSSVVRFWIGCGTHTMAGSNPKALHWAAAAGWNSSDATAQPASPRVSRVRMSCRLHDVHDPQSASPSTTTSHSSTMDRITASGAGLVWVGFS